MKTIRSQDVSDVVLADLRGFDEHTALHQAARELEVIVACCRRILALDALKLETDMIDDVEVIVNATRRIMPRLIVAHQPYESLPH